MPSVIRLERSSSLKSKRAQSLYPHSLYPQCPRDAADFFYPYLDGICAMRGTKRFPLRLRTGYASRQIVCKPSSTRGTPINRDLVIDVTDVLQSYRFYFRINRRRRFRTNLVNTQPQALRKNNHPFLCGNSKNFTIFVAK